VIRRFSSAKPNFPRNLVPDFTHYFIERPADFAKATTAKEVGRPKQGKTHENEK
jgi:hypothetical protein